MSTGNAAAEALKTVAASVAPAWRVQFGLLTGADVAADRFVVVRPAGGGKASRLVRSPTLFVSFIGAVGEAAAACSAVAEAFVAALIDGAAVGVAFLDPTEPVAMPTTDGRPVFEVAVSSIVSL